MADAYTWLTVKDAEITVFSIFPREINVDYRESTMIMKTLCL